jgi:CDP-glycerol glycerophosphotransferase
VPDAGHVPSISVVVPIYNVEPYLAECLESLLAQTAGDLEVVMVDDGSTDGSAAIAERYAELDSCLRLVRQANHGLGHARNTGVAAANGYYLAFADSDDVVPGDAYARLLASTWRGGGRRRRSRCSSRGASAARPSPRSSRRLPSSARF